MHAPDISTGTPKARMHPHSRLSYTQGLHPCRIQGLDVPGALDISEPQAQESGHQTFQTKVAQRITTSEDVYVAKCGWFGLPWLRIAN